MPFGVPLFRDKYGPRLFPMLDTDKRSCCCVIRILSISQWLLQFFWSRGSNGGLMESCVRQWCHNHGRLRRLCVF